MKFYTKDEPEKLLRVDIVHRYSHVVKEGDMIITFQKSKGAADDVAKELYRSRMGIIRDLEAAIQNDYGGTAAVRAMRERYGSSGLLHAALQRQRNLLSKIRVVELLVKY